MPDDRGHRSVPHTADVICEAWGPDLAACLEEAIAALVDVYLDQVEATTVPGPTITLRGEDDRELLLAVLEEVVFLLDSSGLVPVRGSVAAEDGMVAVTFAVMGLDEAVGTGSAPKAISRSELSIEPGTNGIRARFLVDV